MVTRFLLRQMEIAADGRRRLLGQKGLASNQIVGLVFAVITVVIGVTLLNTVVDAAEDVLNNADIADFPLVESLTPLIPVFYVVGLMALAGGIAYLSVRSKA